VDHWGVDYYVSATPGEVVIDMTQDQKLKYVQRNKMGNAEVTVVAAYDNTTVTVYPNAAIISAPLTVTLNANQAYQIQSLVDTVASHTGIAQADIGGSRIIANRPIGVISGNTRAQVVPEVAAFTGNSMKNLGIEWLAPTEQYGTKFIYVPTMDTRHITGARGEKVGEKRGFELVRVYGTSAIPSKVMYLNDSLRTDTVTLGSGRVKDYKIPAVRPHMITTEKPAQVMMHSSAAVRYNGTVSGTAGSASYDSWGAYTVEMVPREQWTTFAPYYAFAFPYETTHYINVIADTNALDEVYDENGAPFDFNMGRIAGTDLMWGTYTVSTGVTHYLEGRNGARFYAYVYGTRQGYELYRPQSTKSPTEYQELMGLTYGYALAPERRILRSGDSLRIDSVPGSCDLKIKVHAINANPVGLAAVQLEDNAVNTRLTVVDPSGPGGVIGFTTAEFDLSATDPLRDASAVLKITDRTGKIWRVRFNYIGDKVNFNAGAFFDLGQINLNESKDTTVLITNSSTKDLCVKQIRLALRNQGLTIESSAPGGPTQNPPQTIVVPPGGSVQVHVKGLPTNKDQTYRDTLRVELCCSEFKLPLRMGAAVPCLQVGDLDFGHLIINQVKTLDLQICNQGGGTIMLNNQAGDSVITWLAQNFSVDPDSLRALRNVSLGAGQCVTVPVTFTATNIPDSVVTTARVWASTRQCRDTSIWRAVVTRPTVGGVAEAGHAKFSLGRIYPNPAGTRTGITFSLAAPGEATVEIYNAIGQNVATLFNSRAEAGERLVVWDVANQPNGIYYCRLTVGHESVTQAILVER
jgi:hypothetical protein